MLLFFVTLWQRTKIESLDRQLADASRNLARSQGKSKAGGLVPLIEDAPFPICYTNLDGVILKASKPFVRLAGTGAKNLEDVAHATGAQLGGKGQRHRHERVALRSEHDENLRHFSLVVWPVKGTHETIGMMYALLEHTTTVHHSQAQHLFDQEVLTLQEELLKDLSHGKADTAALKEVRELTSFLREQSRPHPQRTLEQFDLVTVVKDALELYRPDFRKREVAVTTTLPKQVMVAGYAAESYEVVQLLFAAVAEHATPHSSVRLHVGRQGKHVQLHVSLPGISHKTNLSNFFSFGSKTERRKAQVRLALARLLLGHQQGSFTVTADDEHGVVAHLSFVVGE